MSAPVVCSWFAGCVRDADGCVSHPALGWVPTCSTCAERLGLVLVAGDVIEEPEPDVEHEAFSSHHDSEEGR